MLSSLPFLLFRRSREMSHLSAGQKQSNEQAFETDKPRKWRTISCATTHEVSNSGEIRRKKDGYMFTCSPQKGAGYVGISLRTNDGIQRNLRVHRLVATAFVDNPEPEIRIHVHHRNSIRHDNRASNLQWVSISQNNLARKRRWRGPSSRKVVQFTKSGDPVKLWANASDAALAMECSPLRICNACRGADPTCRGFKWKYYDDVRTDLFGVLWKTVSLKGRVISVSNSGLIKGQNGGICAGYKLDSGYRGFNGLLVHRAVFAAFGTEPLKEGLVINHIDGDRANNHIENLEQVTHGQNLRHSIHVMGNKRRRGRPIAQLTLSGRVLKTFPSTRTAARELGINASNIYAAAYGRMKAASGFKFRHVDKLLTATTPITTMSSTDVTSPSTRREIISDEEMMKLLLASSDEDD